MKIYIVYGGKPQLKNPIKLRSGVSVPELTKKEAEAKCYLTRTTLSKMHLIPAGDPVAYMRADDGSVIYFFDPEKVKEAAPELWYYAPSKGETMTLENGTVIERMSTKRAASYGYYTLERLASMKYDTMEEPVAFTYRKDKSLLFFYDKKTAIRQPLMCVKCGKKIRFKRKLCEDCYAEDLAERRAEGDLHRNSYYGMDPKKVIFFDLELTGVYDHDEIISITITDAEGSLIMDTLVKPAHTKKWKRTEKIHGITPDMVADAPLLETLKPELRRIFDNADNVIAYGVATDYSHIKYIYDTEEEREAFHQKTRCCANEFVRYIHEHRPDVVHASLTDAMECMQIEWDGTAHTSIADTIGCRKVWAKLFPHYYESEPTA